MDDPVFKAQYDKYKLRVKKWEKEFIKKFRRIPSKYDIRDASDHIRYSYKMYYKLKTSFLEKTISDVFSEDGFDILDNETSQGDFDNSSSYDFSNIFSPSGRNILDDEESRQSSSRDNSYADKKNIEIDNFEPVEELESNKKAWVNVPKSKSFNETATKATKVEKFQPPTRAMSNITSKLFQSSQSSSFVKRNPRKSLSKLSSSSSSTNLTDSNKLTQHESLPDLETILTSKAKEHKSPLQNLSILNKPKEITMNVDQEWLDRIEEPEELNVLKSPMVKTYKSPHAKQNDKRKFGLSNINVPMYKLSPIKTPKKNTPHKNSPRKTPQKTQNENANVVRNIYQFNNDSDEVISNSEDENGLDKKNYRHIAKRRRILRDIDRNKLPSLENKLNKTPIKSLSEGSLNKTPVKVKEMPSLLSFNSNESFPASLETVLSKEMPILEKNYSNESIGIDKVMSDIKSIKEEEKSEASSNKTKKLRRKRKPLIKEQSDDSDDDNYNPKKVKEAKQKGRPKKLSKEKSQNTTTTSSKRTNGKAKKKTLQTIEENIIENDQTNEDADFQPPNLALEAGCLKSLPSANYEELKIAENILESYITNSQSFKKVVEKSKSLEPLKSAKQLKLEEKIRTGRLNENFVRVDVNKKIYVRGKKTMNYSKYKKKLWKNKKEMYAVSGPNMDLRGCDGGILVCHKCNQPGHFARQCKMKGDSLAPLNVAELDQSPHLTLEEAANMAQQKALSVHSRNLSKLPEVNNLKIIKNDDEEIINDSQDEDEEEKEANEDKTHSNSGKDSDEFEIDDEFDDAIMQLDENNLKNEKPNYIGHKIPEDFLEKCGINNNKLDNNKDFKPIYDLNPDGSVKQVTDEVLKTLRMFGHESFRKGQEKAIMRILSGLSTLVTLSTGSGKSLCYQLPAYLYSRKMGSITLVISPLVSLMEDQVTDVPGFLRAYCLHTNQTPQQKLKVMDLISKGEIDILLVSPEAVVSGEKSNGFGALLGDLPPIAFACIDEAHCVSQWSHNFRPSYLMICKVLKTKLGVKTILGLTATATRPTRQSIIRHLDIRDGEEGIIKDIPLPDNLILSVSYESNRENALMQLLRSERFEHCQSVIVYCTRRDECERVAGFIRTCMQDKPALGQTKSKRKRINWHAEPYHAGLPASRRRTIQNAFMKNELRIVVATIAFGMGINKPDIRAVIHYNMPKSYESYVQEIGRAGRDGKISHCHLFLDSRGQDHSELKKHIYGNSIDRHVIRKLLQKIFIPCSCNKNLKRRDFQKSHAEEIEASQNMEWNDDFEQLSNYYDVKPKQRLCPGHEIGFSIEETVQYLDLPEENISTLLCYLELDGRYNLNLLSNAYTKCKVMSYGGPSFLKTAAKNCPPLAMAIAIQLKNGKFDEEKNLIEFCVIEIASTIGWNSGVVKHQLKQLEWTNENGIPKRSAISVRFYDLGFRVKAPGDFTYEEIDEALDSLYQRSVLQEKNQLVQLQCIQEGLGSAAFKSCFPCCKKEFNNEISNKLKFIIRNYFQQDGSMNVELKTIIDDTSDAIIISDIKSMIQMYPDNNFTGRSIARIFYGIGSPNYTPMIWSRCKYWRAHMKVDFNKLIKLANDVIVRLRM